ncbi:MAG: integrase [Nitrosopumilaceae archaeon]
MEIRPDEIIKTQQNPIDLFYQGIKAKYTRDDYTRKLKKVLCEFLNPILVGDPQKVKRQKKDGPSSRPGIKLSFFDADFEDRANEFVKKANSDPEWAEAVLLKMSEKLRERTQLEKTDEDYLNPRSIYNYFKPIQKLFEMNGVAISWKRIKSTFPEEESSTETTEYSLKEIKRMLNHARVQDKVIVLLAASSGIRAGAFDFKWKHVRPIFEYQGKLFWEDSDVTETISSKGNVIAMMVKIYSGSKYEYIAFGTPECWKAIEAYKEHWEKEIGYPPKPEQVFFKQHGDLVRPLTTDGVRKRLERVLVESGVRTPKPKGVRQYRVPAFNGFRRFFNKQNKKSLSKGSALSSLILKENMMGHTGLIKLDENYFKEHIHELIEEYLLAIPYLTISDEQRERIKNTKLSEENSRLRKKQTEIKILEKRIEGMEKDKGKSIEKVAGILNDEIVKRDSTLEELMKKMAQMSKELRELKKHHKNEN